MADIKTQLDELATELAYHKSLVTLHNKKVFTIRDRMKKLKKGLSAKYINVTDHAVVTYMKRYKSDVIGLEIEDVRAIIKEAITESALSIGGNGIITLENDITYVVKNHKVVTVYNKRDTK